MNELMSVELTLREDARSLSPIEQVKEAAEAIGMTPSSEGGATICCRISQHENHQRPIKEIERRAGISFGGLADLDPLRDATESTPTMLTSLSQVRFTE